MHASHLARSTLCVLATGGALVVSFGTSASLTACGDTPGCTKLRDDTFATLQTWESCDPNAAEPCLVVLGNPKDCTGVLACNFAVNPAYRADAEKTVLTMPEQSQGCFLCATPNCPGGSLPWCEPVNRKCMIVDMVLEGGVATTTSVPPDSGVATGEDAASPVGDGAGEDAGNGG